MEKISFCIPCYRSAKTIIPVIEEIDKFMLPRSNEYSYEVVAVVDGSPDNVFDVLRNYSINKKYIKVVNFSKNFSQANARMATIRYATGDYLVCLDDDGQCPMSKVWDLLQPLFEDRDVSIADYPHKKQSAFKNFGSRLNKLMIQLLMDVPKNFKMSNFFAMKKFIAKQILEYTNPYPYLTGLIVQTTKNIAYVEMEERDRAEGTTGYTFSKLIKLWMNGFTAFSVVPLRVSSIVGVICAIIGFIFGIVTIIRKLVVQNISVGWSSTVSIMLFIGGLIMLMLGMIGEYIGRIYISINNSPQYVVKETINIDKDE